MIRHLYWWWRWSTRNPLEIFDIEDTPLVIETWLSVIEKIEKKIHE